MNQLGYYGKTPHRGDFVRFNLPQAFINVWDDWLQQVITEGQQRYPDNWTNLYDQAPTYRFVLSAGIAGKHAWAGVLLASQDKVGRRFPFCVSVSLADKLLPCEAISRLDPWFADAEQLMSNVQSADFNFDELQADLVAIAEKHTELDVHPDSQISPTSSNQAGNLTLHANSSNALRHHSSTLSVLDAVLTQTLAEYSLWVSSENDGITILSNGLPLGQSGLALFSSNWDSCDCARIQLPESPMAPPLVHESVHNKDETVPASDNDATSHAGNDPDTQSPGSSPVTPSQGPPGGTDDLPLRENISQQPTADDWAALEELEDSAETIKEVPVPEVEPLELEDDSSADAPWEA